MVFRNVLFYFLNKVGKTICRKHYRQKPATDKKHRRGSFLRLRHTILIKFTLQIGSLIRHFLSHLITVISYLQKVRKPLKMLNL